MTEVENPRAYPSTSIDDKYGGMSLRDAFALASIAPLVARLNFGVPNYGEDIAITAYKIADAMIVERNKR